MAYTFVTKPVRYSRRGGAGSLRWGEMFDALAAAEDGAVIHVENGPDETDEQLARRLGSAVRNQGRRTGCKFSVRRGAEGGVYVLKVASASDS